MTGSMVNLVELLRALWQRRWLGLAVAWLVALAAAAVISQRTERYEATARVYVDTQTVLRPLLSGLAVQPDLDRMVGMLARNLVSRPNMEKVAADPAVGFPRGSERANALIVEDLIRDVRLTAGGGQNLYTLRYRDTDPARAEAVIEKTVALFVATGVGDKRQDTSQARHFIDEQIASHEEKLRDAENRLKDFKLRHIGFTGASGQDSFARIALIQDDLSRARLDLRALTEARDSLRRQLAGESPVTAGGATGMRSSPTAEMDARVESVRRQLDDLTRRYTDAHPDVQATRRLLGQLESERARELEALRHTGGGGPQTASNPVFQQLKMALGEAESKAAAAQARVSELQSRIDQIRSDAAKYPQVEAELAQLNRDYDVIRRNYDQLVARRESASLSQEVDTSASMASFKVIEPPHVLPQPVFPDRRALLVLALLAAVGCGVAAAFVAAQWAPTVNSVMRLRELVKRPVLGALSMQADPAQVRRQQLAHAVFGVGVLIPVVVYAAWAAWLTLAPVVR